MKTTSWLWSEMWLATRLARQVAIALVGLALAVGMWWWPPEDWRVSWLVWGLAGTWQFQHVWPGIAALVAIGANAVHTGATAAVTGFVVWDLVLTAAVCGWAAAMRRQWDLAQRLRRIDPLTHLLNRMGTIERLEQEIARANRQLDPLVIVFIDCDNFKLVNDAGGHAAGDQLLWEFGLVLRQNIREYDLAGRLGGDEFLLVLPHSTAEDGFRIARRIVAGLKLLKSPARQPLTLSAGVVAFAAPIPPVAECLQQADEAMYEAKQAGKDGLHLRVVGPELSTVLGGSGTTG